MIKGGVIEHPTQKILEIIGPMGPKLVAELFH